MARCIIKEERCLNCHDHFQQLRLNISEVVISKHFRKDAPDFDITLVIDCNNIHFTRLHKFEENIQGNYIFRAIHNEKHIVYCIDKMHRLIFLRAFENFKTYKKFLDKKKEILGMIRNT